MEKCSIILNLSVVCRLTFQKKVYNFTPAIVIFMLVDSYFNLKCVHIQQTAHSSTYHTMVSVITQTNDKGYVSRSQAVSRVRNKLAACAKMASSSGPVLFWFWAMKSCRILRRTLFDPLSHSLSRFITCAMAMSCFADPIFGLFIIQNIHKKMQ